MLSHIPLNSKVSNASLVVEGKVVSQVSFWDIGNKNIFTRNKIEVYKIFKGSLQTAFIEVITQGGIVGNDMQTVEPSLQLKVGEIGVFTCNNTTVNVPFTHTSSIPQFDAYASVQGFIKYDLQSQSAIAPFEKYSDISTVLYQSINSVTNNNYQTIKTVNLNPSQGMQFVVAPSITNISPLTVTAGTKTQITITGSNFGASQGSGFVEFFDANTASGVPTYTPLASEYISWNDNTIVVEVPSRAGTGTIDVTQAGSGSSGQTLTVSYSQLNYTTGGNAYQPDHVDDNGSGGYTFQMHTDFDANSAAKASFLRALDTWRCNTAVNWTNGATTAIDAVASDNVNVVRFDNGGELSVGVLGVCSSWRSFCGGNTAMVVELDIVFDDAASWEYGPALPGFTDYDFETVAVHELGHAHQLGHVISPGAIMHYAISNGDANRSLGVNDQAGGDFVQAQSIVANSCGSGAMTNYVCGTVPVANFSASTTTPCPGDAVVFTDLSTNIPLSWSWVFQGGTPATSTSQNPAVTFATPGLHSVTLTAGNVAGDDAEVKVGYINVGTCTKLKTAYCGITLASLNDYVHANAIIGATQYQFRFIHAASSFTATYASPNAKVTGNGISGIQYGKTYNVDVRVMVGGVWGNYGIVCTVTTPPAIPTTSLKPSSCGITLANLNDYVYANTAVGASTYQFRFVHAASSFTATYSSNVAKAPGIGISGIQYGRTYDVDVRVMVGGVWGTFGAVCLVTTPPAVPTTQLKPVDCGRTLSALNEFIRAEAVIGVNQYEFRFINSISSFTATVNRGTAIVNVSSVPGIQYATTYNVDVRAQVGGVWGNYGAVCTITTPGSPMVRQPSGSVDGFDQNLSNSEESQYGTLKQIQNTSLEENNLSIEVYPNPTHDGNVMMDIASLSGEIVLIKLYDLAGRELLGLSKAITPGVSNIIPGEFGSLGLSNGIYILKVSVGTENIYQKLIVE